MFKRNLLQDGYSFVSWVTGSKPQFPLHVFQDSHFIQAYTTIQKFEVDENLF